MTQTPCPQRAQRQVFWGEYDIRRHTAHHDYICSGWRIFRWVEIACRANCMGKGVVMWMCPPNWDAWGSLVLMLSQTGSRADVWAHKMGDKRPTGIPGPWTLLVLSRCGLKEQTNAGCRHQKPKPCHLYAALLVHTYTCEECCCSKPALSDCGMETWGQSVTTGLRHDNCVSPMQRAVWTGHLEYVLITMCMVSLRADSPMTGPHLRAARGGSII